MKDVSRANLCYCKIQITTVEPTRGTNDQYFLHGLYLENTSHVPFRMTKMGYHLDLTTHCDRSEKGTERI